MPNRQWYITKYGEEAFIKKLAELEKWKIGHPDQVKKTQKRNDQKRHRKSGMFYSRRQEYEHSHLRKERAKIRAKHRYYWSKYKGYISPQSSIHHAWVSKTADYTGVALVEANAHRHGIIDVICILDGEITLLKEEWHR